MQNINDRLLELGFDWEEFGELSIYEKSFILAWEEHDWDEVLALNAEYGLGTPDEIEMAERYRERAT